MKEVARPHLAKAEEYLRAAKLVLPHGLDNATCSLAITSGINAKDVICLLSVGYTDKGESHDKAVAELTKSGPAGARLAPTLSRLLVKKTKSQYSSTSVTGTDPDDAVKRAERLVEAAREVFASAPK